MTLTGKQPRNLSEVKVKTTPVNIPAKTGTVSEDVSRKCYGRGKSCEIGAGRGKVAEIVMQALTFD